MGNISVKVKGERPVQILAHSFIVSPSSEGYTLNYSADGKNWTAWTAATPANDNLIVNGLAFGSYIKFAGNNSELMLSY